MNFLKPTRCPPHHFGGMLHNIQTMLHMVCETHTHTHTQRQIERACVMQCVCSDSILYTFETSFSYSIILPFPLCWMCVCECVPSRRPRTTFTFSPPSPHTIIYQKLCDYITSKIKMSSVIYIGHTHSCV